jgi:hypothetical protein
LDSRKLLFWLLPFSNNDYGCYSYYDWNNKRNELNLKKNKQTEFGNVQVELQQKESNEQRIQQEIQKNRVRE